MSDNNEKLRKAAQEMIANRRDLKKDLVSEGIYRTVVEGGHHTEALTNEEAEDLFEVISEKGIEGLESLAAEAEA